jgi:amphi-Trp domain-containing protein
MSEIEFSRTATLSRKDAAALLRTLADALDADGHAHLQLGDSRVGLRVPAQVEVEVEVEVDSGAVELEVELTWSLGGARSRSRAAGTEE